MTNNNKFNLLSEDDPTDEQLSFLMKEVAKDSLKRSIKAEKKFQEELKKLVKDTIENWEQSTQQKL
ncbi:MAG TPA: hypothetical protein V6C58_00250 [Allocoleopsis sp.]